MRSVGNDRPVSAGRQAGRDKNSAGAGAGPPVAGYTGPKEKTIAIFFAGKTFGLRRKKKKRWFFSAMPYGLVATQPDVKLPPCWGSPGSGSFGTFVRTWGICSPIGNPDMPHSTL
jgi:hypothetical protein